MYLKRIFTAVLPVFFILIPVSASAAVDYAPPQGVGAIAWTMKMSGPMPKMMMIGLILIAVMLIITVIVAKMNSEEDKNE